MLGGLVQTLRGTPDQEMAIASPESIKERRALARKLLEQSVDVSPVQHWTQGAARMAQALQGVTADWAADREEKRGQQAGKDIETKLLSSFGGGATATPEPSSIAPDVAPAPRQSSAAPNMTGVDPRIRDGIITTAKSVGIDPTDLATAISYETAGTFDPMKDGPRTQWGQHRGLIQFGEPQARENGVNWDDPIGSQLGENGAIANYLRKAGVKPGMGMMDVYSAINAGSPGLYNRTDANNGGAPGTVRDKVESQMAGHRAKAMALIGVPHDITPGVVNAQTAVYRGGAEVAIAQPAIDAEGQTPPAIPIQATQGANAEPQTSGKAAASPSPVSGDPSRMSLAQLMAMQNSPGFAYATPGTKQIVQALIQRSVTQETRDPRDGVIKDLNIERMRRESQTAATEMERVTGNDGRQYERRKGGNEAFRPVQGIGEKTTEMETREDPATGRIMQRLKGGVGPFSPVEGMGAKEEPMQLVDVPNADGTSTKMWLRKGEGQGTAVGAPFKPKAQVEINNATEKEEDKAKGKGRAEFLNKEADDAPKASQRAADLGQLMSITSVTDTGIGTPGRAMLDNIGRQFGFTDGQLASKTEAINAIVNRIAPTLREAGSGTVSDADLRGFMASLPSLSATPEGNALIMSTLKRASEMQVARANIAAAWRADDISGKEAQKQITELNNRSIYASDEERRIVAGLKPRSTSPAGVPSSTAAPAPVQPGQVRKFNPATGMIE